MAGVLAWLLYLASQSETGMPIAVATSVLTIGAAWEATRMGSLRSRSLGFALLGPIAVSIFLSMDHVRDVIAKRYAGYETSLVHELLLVVALAALGLAGSRFLKRRKTESALTFTGLTIAIIFIAFLAVDLRAQLSGTALNVVFGIGAAASVAFAHSLTRFSKSDLRWAIGLALWIALPLAWIWHVWELFGAAAMIALVVLSKIGDIAAYYGGNAFGKHHPLPNLSPGKTIEGFACSVAAGVITGGIMASTDVLNCGIMAGALAGLIVNVASQAGDLLESWVKRNVGVKDSSAAFGPSGGFLDVVDSLLLSAPAALLTWPWLLTT